MVIRLQSGGGRNGMYNRIVPDASGNWSIPVEKIDGYTDMAEMFFGDAASITSMDLSGWNTSNVTDMGRMFSSCYSLTSLDLSSWDVSNVTNMYQMFYSCESLTSLDLSGWDTSNVTDMGWMFADCKNLKTIRMVGCSEETRNKVWKKMPSGCTIVTE